MFECVDHPRVSVITPSYNQGRFLEATIHSVVSQEYPNVEHIIIDGGSTDGSVDILRRHTTELAHWVSEPDQGQSDAFNKGMKVATGRIVGWLNSDDMYEPGALTAVAEYFVAHPEAQIVYGDTVLIDTAGHVVETLKGDYSRNKYIHIWRGYQGFHETSTFFRRQVFDKFGPFDKNLHYAMDYDFYLKAGEVCDFHYLPVVISQFRVHDSAKGSQGWENYLAEIRSSARRFWFRRNMLELLYVEANLRHAEVKTLLKRAYALQDQDQYRRLDGILTKCFLLDPFTTALFLVWRAVHGAD